ncbi:MAG: polymerase sigma-70 factor, subfamily [Myxococcales bacterium]|nr:polymerase sigma-70 factor, subfamily [Myxococcales bacterium]
MSDETDEQLMYAYREGNPAAFELLLARHERKVWNFLRRSVGDPTLAEDLLQEVFLRVIKAHADSFDWRGEAKFTTWVYAIARNLCIDHSRRAVHRDARSLDAPTRPDDESSSTLHDHLASPDRDAEGLTSDAEVRTRVDAAVAALPEDQREVFLLREVMDMPFAEIARVVGAPEPTVKSRMRYALERLREALDDLHGGAPAPRAAKTGEAR